MMNCYFCGGRVIGMAGETVAGRGRNVTGYRCEAEGVWWDVTENLTIYTPSERGRPRSGVYLGAHEIGVSVDNE